MNSNLVGQQSMPWENLFYFFSIIVACFFVFMKIYKISYLIHFFYHSLSIDSSR